MIKSWFYGLSSMMTSKQEVDGGLQKAEEARSALEQIVAISPKSLEMIASIASATEKQAAVTAEISGNIESIARGTRTTETASDKVQDLARKFAKLSQNLKQTAVWFKVSRLPRNTAPRTRPEIVLIVVIIFLTLPGPKPAGEPLYERIPTCRSS